MSVRSARRRLTRSAPASRGRSAGARRRRRPSPASCGWPGAGARGLVDVEVDAVLGALRDVGRADADLRVGRRRRRRRARARAPRPCRGSTLTSVRPAGSSGRAGRRSSWPTPSRYSGRSVGDRRPAGTPSARRRRCRSMSAAETTASGSTSTMTGRMSHRGPPSSPAAISAEAGEDRDRRDRRAAAERGDEADAGGRRPARRPARAATSVARAIAAPGPRRSRRRSAVEAERRATVTAATPNSPGPRRNAGGASVVSRGDRQRDDQHDRGRARAALDPRRLAVVARQERDAARCRPRCRSRRRAATTPNATRKRSGRPRSSGRGRRRRRATYLSEVERVSCRRSGAEAGRSGADPRFHLGSGHGPQAAAASAIPPLGITLGDPGILPSGSVTLVMRRPWCG